jgi:endonuclease YncB( thermonuclease family)
MFKSLQYARLVFHRKLPVMVLVVLFAFLPVFAGDSFYGKVTEVKGADVIIVDNGKLSFEVRIIGIDVPREGRVAEKAKEFVTNLLLGKNARIRHESRTRSNVMIARVFTAEEDTVNQDVGVELVKAGFARVQKGSEEQFGYKYKELSKASTEARRARRGVWARGGGR